MPQTRECDYCGQDIEPGTGTMFVRTDGSTTYYCSSKCEKNADLGREPRDTEWTAAAREQADRRASQAAQESAAEAGREDQDVDETADARSADESDTESEEEREQSGADETADADEADAEEDEEETEE
ncbi:50S ribosomal protein L24e [Halostella sp. JP-L12]|uniref:50S ribosomal protein L24e n=1 Tax=Halostella TaxID=1843185 RepID=UPI000EF78695|nr:MULTISPECIES: 50S ribosomal protein L24e [Halostella]NHN48989.1 50S ribosomal protein L24e [Halostella sp. JP-L12]